MVRRFRLTNIIYIVVQLVLLALWGFGVIDRTFFKLILVLIPTWFPYVLIVPLKIVEKRLRKKINDKIKENGQKETK